MVPNLLPVILTAQSLSRIWIQELKDQMPCSQSKEIRKFDCTLQYFFVNSFGLLIVIERRVARQQFIDQDTYSPIINRFVIAIFVIFIKHFRSQILGCPTNSECPLPMHFFRKAHIDKFGETIRINHYILRFQISEDYVLLMEVDDGIQNSTNIKESHIIGKSPIFSQSSEELSTLNILKQHEDVFVILECRFQTNNIWMCNIQQHLFFRVKVHQLILFNDLLFPHNFQSIHLFFVLETHKFDPAECPIPQSADNLKVVSLQFPKYFIIEFFKLLFLHNDDNNYNMFQCL